MSQPFVDHRISPSPAPDLSFLLGRAPTPGALTEQAAGLQRGGREVEQMDMRRKAQALEEDQVKQRMALQERDQKLKEILWPLEVKQKSLALEQMVGGITRANFELDDARRRQREQQARDLGRLHGMQQDPSKPLALPENADPAFAAGAIDGRRDKALDNAHTDAGARDKVVLANDLELFKRMVDAGEFHGTSSDWASLGPDKKATYRRKAQDINLLEGLAAAGVDLDDPDFADIKRGIASIASNPGSLEGDDYNYVSRLELETLKNKAVERKKEIAQKKGLEMKTDAEIKVVGAREEARAKARKVADDAAFEARKMLKNMETEADFLKARAFLERKLTDPLISDEDKTRAMNDFDAAVRAHRESFRATPPGVLPPLTGSGAVDPAAKPIAPAPVKAPSAQDWFKQNVIK